MPTFKELLDPNRNASRKEWQEFALKMYEQLPKIAKEGAWDAGDLNIALEEIIQKEIDLTGLTTQQLLQFTDMLIQISFDDDMSEAGYKLNAWCALLVAPVTKKLEEQLQTVFQANQGTSNEKEEGPNYEIMQTMNCLEKLAELNRKTPEKYSATYNQYVEQHTQSLQKYFEDPKWATRVFVEVKRSITAMAGQLTALFHNSPALNVCIKPYIDDQKTTLLSLTKTNNPYDLVQYLQQLNLVSAIGAMIAAFPSLADQFKQSDDELKGIALLGEKIQALSSKEPKKAHAIHAALAEIVWTHPTMTFNHIVEGMRTNTDKNNALGKLKTAMGKHRNIFWKIVNYFFQVDTATMILFKEKIQEQRNPKEINIKIGPLQQP